MHLSIRIFNTGNQICFIDTVDSLGYNYSVENFYVLINMHAVTLTHTYTHNITLCTLTKPKLKGCH